MKTIWIIILLVILVRSIWRRMERTGAPDRYEEPAGTTPSDLEEPPLESVPEDGGRRKLNLPDYITGRGSGPVAPVEEDETPAVAERAAMSRPPVEAERPGSLARELRLEVEDCLPLPENLPNQTRVCTPRERRKRRGGGDYFIDISGPGQVLKGVVWAEILGPRGGIQAKRRK